MQQMIQLSFYSLNLEVIDLIQKLAIVSKDIQDMGAVPNDHTQHDTSVCGQNINNPNNKPASIDALPISFTKS